MKKKIAALLALSFILTSACSTVQETEEVEETEKTEETSVETEEETSAPTETTEEVVEVDLQDYSGMTAEEICVERTKILIENGEDFC